MFALPVAEKRSAGHAQSSFATQPPRTAAIEPPHPRVAAAGPNHGPQWNFSQVPVFSRESPLLPIQAKLTIGQTNDPLEHEADRIAGQVVGDSGSPLSFTSTSPHLDRKCASCEQEEQPSQLQRYPSSGVAEQEAPGSVHDALQSPGRPLDPSVRTLMEPRFGFDFSAVQVHTGGGAAKSADDVGALAYTVGRQIVFADGQYNPASIEGQRLLAHELAHVVQQNNPQTATHSNAGPASTQVAGSSTAKVTGQGASGTVQRAPKNPLDDTAKRIIEAAKDAKKSVDQRAIDAVNDIVKAYYDSSMVDSVVYKEDEPGLSTTPIGKGKDIKGKITVGREFIDHIDTFARRVLQVGHELEHVRQQREGMGGHDKSNEREFLAFYWESTQPEKGGTGSMSHAGRVSLIDEALRNYYCLADDLQKTYATKKDELLTLRTSEDGKGGNDHTDPPTSCPAKK